MGDRALQVCGMDRDSVFLQAGYVIRALTGAAYPCLFRAGFYG